MSQLSNILAALNDCVWGFEQETRKTLDRQIELEQCVYSLLQNSKPTKKQYASVFKRLDGIEKHLRNVALHGLAKKRATPQPGGKDE